MTQQCSNCFYSRRFTSDVNGYPMGDGMYAYECRRNPPKGWPHRPATELPLLQSPPLVDPLQWCGEWRARPAKGGGK